MSVSARVMVGPADLFTGDVWFDVIAKGDQPSRLRANMVGSPGANTAGHCHANGQPLHIADGLGLVQSRGGELVRIPEHVIGEYPAE